MLKGDDPLDYRIAKSGRKNQKRNDTMMAMKW